MAEETLFGSSQAASLGGKARAKTLSVEEKRDSARHAAEARWAKKGISPTPRATHEGPLSVGNMAIDCAVLEDGRRVISERAFSRALNVVRGGYQYRQRGKIEGGGELPIFLAIPGLIPFIDKELMLAVQKPISYITKSGATASGIEAKLVPMVCNVWLKARDANVLSPRQKMAAMSADILMRGLGEVGIAALVDEATGYQDVRARDALAKILEAFVTKELRQWVKTFPPDYYKELFRLRGLKYPPDKNPPQYIGTITNDIIYSRLAPAVLEELKAKNPVNDKGHRKAKHHQWLTEQIGHPKLLQHLAAVVALMRVCKNGDYKGFKDLLNRALPKYEDGALAVREES